MGIKKIDAILTKFGFGQPTGIDLPNELGGVLPSPAWKMKSYQQNWYLGDTVITAIGQGYFLVTPLGLAVHTATLATRGKHYRPYLLDAIETDGNKTYTQPHALPPVKLQHPQVWQTVLNAMRQVISKDGTAWRFGVPKNYTAAAKTGTAQVTSTNFGEDYTHVPEKLRPDSWIIVFAPYQQPEIAIAVLVEHSPGASAPVSRKIADYYFAHRQEILSTTKVPTPKLTNITNTDSQTQTKKDDTTN
jgi:penicillin-binding protein 2